MSETQTRTVPPQPPRLALGDLQAVQWVAAQPGVRSTYDSTKERYLALKKAAVIGWIIGFYEMTVVWWWTFLHNLPWPQIALNLLDKVDAQAVRFLDYSQQKLEWWWDATGVRVMWLKESVLLGLDRHVTTIDTYLLRFQDAVVAFVSVVLRPVTAMYKMITAPARVKEQKQRKQGVVGETSSPAARHGAYLESDMAEDEDTEEWMDSDASSDSRRLHHGGDQGASYSQHSSRVTAEGRLRAAMYRRVKRELRIMRKNSIRFSYGIVNYARQLMEPRVRPYAASFQDYYQKWARDHELQELMTPLQEEWSSDKRPLGKALGLARALCVVYLAFLLRLAKGKKSRRTRSMRSESLRRRAQNLACPTPPPTLSPSALQQSSEPAPPPPLEVPPNLQEPALKEEDEDLDGSQAKDSALGSELDNPSDHQDSSDHAISPISEEQESDHEYVTHKKEKLESHAIEKENLESHAPDSPVSENMAGTICCPPSIRKDSDKEDKEELRTTPKHNIKKGVTIMSPKPQKSKKNIGKSPNKKTTAYGGNFAN